MMCNLDHVTGYTAGVVPPGGGFTARVDLAHYIGAVVGDASRVGTISVISTREGRPTMGE
jgi:hypothetical protein